MNTFIAKDIRNNWKATSDIMISDDRQLTITTSKVEGNLKTTASVGKKDGMFISFAMFQDFYVVKAVKKYKRITSKIVENQHAEIMLDIDSIITDAKTFYNLV